MKKQFIGAVIIAALILGMTYKSAVENEKPREAPTLCRLKAIQFVTYLYGGSLNGENLVDSPESILFLDGYIQDGCNQKLLLEVATEIME